MEIKEVENNKWLNISLLSFLVVGDMMGVTMSSKGGYIYSGFEVTGS